MPSVILMSIWAGVGFSMVIYLAGLQAIPEELYEAAKVDGAGALAPAALHHHPAAGARRRCSCWSSAIIGSLPGLHADLHHDQRRAGRRDDDDRLLHLRRRFKFSRWATRRTLAYALFAMIFVFTCIQLRFLYREAE